MKTEHVYSRCSIWGELYSSQHSSIRHGSSYICGLCDFLAYPALPQRAGNTVMPVVRLSANYIDVLCLLLVFFLLLSTSGAKYSD